MVGSQVLPADHRHLGPSSARARSASSADARRRKSVVPARTLAGGLGSGHRGLRARRGHERSGAQPSVAPRSLRFARTFFAPVLLDRNALGMAAVSLCSFVALHYLRAARDRHASSGRPVSDRGLRVLEAVLLGAFGLVTLTCAYRTSYMGIWTWASRSCGLLCCHWRRWPARRPIVTSCACCSF